MSKKSIYNKDILKTLADVGVYISNYITGEDLISKEWKSIPRTFNLKDKDKDKDKDSFFDFIHTDDRARVKNAIEAIYNGDTNKFHEIYRLEYSKGLYKWIDSFGKTATKTEDGKTEYFVGFDLDISDLKKTEQKLRISIEKEEKRTVELETLRQIIKVINSSLELKETVQIVLNETKKLIPYETASVEMLRDGFLKPIGTVGFEDNDFVNNLKFKYPDNNSLSTYALQNNKPLLCNNIAKEFPVFSQPKEDKSVKSWIGIPLISKKNIIGLLALDGYKKNHFNEHHLELSEIIGDHIAIALENSILHEKAYKMAMEDALTHLGSRYRMQIEGRLLFNNAVRSKSNISVAMLDIDFFKKINDNFGHKTGDTVLKTISKACIDEVRNIDVLARYGGEEFILIMQHTLLEEAEIILTRIKNKIELLKHPGIPYPVTISVGISSGIPKRENLLDSYISIADKQLYISKENGRNRITSKAIY